MKFMALFLLLCSINVFAATAIKPYEFYICSNRKLVRSLRVEVLEDKTCRTMYSKGGRDKTIGSGIHLESCVNFLNNVKGNLESAGWSCRKIDKVNISSSQNL
ncbi:MAG: hypothetical protein KDD40_05640 [Bdellovibrionales bacterium]|nr:hypothetical protein [Bdellovibrionales bacterium]